MYKRVINRRAATAGTLAILVALLYAPVCMVLVYSFNDSRIGSVWTHFSLRWYTELFSRGDLWAALKVSIVVASIASSVSIVLATLASLGVVKIRSRRIVDAVTGVLFVPLVLPDVFLGISLALLFNALSIPRTLLTVILSHLVFGVSYAFVVIHAAMLSLDPALHDAAIDCGATPLQAHTRVTIPTLRPTIAVAWLFVFVLSFDDFLITFFTKGVGTDTLPIKIFSQMRFGVRPDTNAMFVVIAVFGLLAMGAAARLGRGRIRIAYSAPLGE
jgi:ABC-type spermidine/putrescine transport system permease subunit II